MRFVVVQPDGTVRYFENLFDSLGELHAWSYESGWFEENDYITRLADKIMAALA